ncbi:hypothetical protein C6P45_002797 [Maudiozyma exigua]|uniref:Uncharacterized protein n=1 Tax=Maudiozyma exigua TaxID=34358 RepID=A0A9P6WCL6_MAUEX|nr:hypothetical protein C6P45_002797 [Kazachstania exigua]
MSRVLNKKFIEQNCLFIRFGIRFPTQPKLTSIAYNRLVSKKLETISDVLYCRPTVLGSTFKGSNYPFMDFILASDEVTKLSKVIAGLMGIQLDPQGDKIPNIDKEATLDRMYSLVYHSNTLMANNISSDIFVDNIWFDHSKMDKIETLGYQELSNTPSNFSLSSNRQLASELEISKFKKKRRNKKLFCNNIDDLNTIGLKPYYLNDYNVLPYHLKRWISNMNDTHNFNNLIDVSNRKDSDALNLMLHGFRGFKKY